MPQVAEVSHSFRHHLVKCHEFVGAWRNCCSLLIRVGLCVRSFAEVNYEEHIRLAVNPILCLHLREGSVQAAVPGHCVLLLWRRQKESRFNSN